MKISSGKKENAFWLVLEPEIQAEVLQLEATALGMEKSGVLFSRKQATLYGEKVLALLCYLPYIPAEKPEQFQVPEPVMPVVIPDES